MSTNKPTPPPNKIEKEGVIVASPYKKKPLLCRLGVHFNKKNISYTIVYTECKRCGARDYFSIGRNYTALNKGWLDGKVNDIHDWSWMDEPTFPLYTPSSIQRVRIPDYTLEGCRAYANSLHPNPSVVMARRTEVQKRIFWLLDYIDEQREEINYHYENCEEI